MFMRKIFLTVSAVMAMAFNILSAEEITVYYNNVPVMCGDNRNVVCEVSIFNDGTLTRLDEISADIQGVDCNVLKRVRLVYGGAGSCVLSRTTSEEMREYSRRWAGGQKLFDDDGFVLDVCEIKPGRDGKLVFKADKKLVPGWNYFFISLNADPKKLELGQSFELKVNDVKVSGESRDFVCQGDNTFRFGVSVRTHNDDGVDSYRIPGLVTTKKGTLIAVYDIRYISSFDLQTNIDIGVSRSTDGGRTWGDMIVAMDMGEWGGLPEAQNGIGDPSVLVDETTGEIFIVAAWTHGMGNIRAWGGVGTGFEPHETAQLMISSSKDDGKTWSKPRNITRQVKEKEWYFTLQGPGRGITMKDGTLVFPIQHIAPDRVPWSGIMYSRDHGKTWKTHTSPKSHTTESQVAEVEPGVLMLNMRNDKRTGRMVYTTTDMGQTWTEHCSSGKLQESVCMASLISIPAEDNVFGKDILLFSNPNTQQGRNHMTIKASLDYGKTWLEANQLMIDAEESWGYSCLSLIDPETVGIFYECSQAQIGFQSIKLKDIVKTL